MSFTKFAILGTHIRENVFRKNISPCCTLKFEGNKCGRVKLLGRVFKKSGKVLCRVFKKVAKVRVELNKFGLKFSWGEMLVTCGKLSHFLLTFVFPHKVLRQWPFIFHLYFSKQIEFDLKSINQEAILLLKSLDKEFIQYFSTDPSL